MIRASDISPGVVASNRIGNLIGARTAIGARNAAHAIAFISVIVGFMVMIIMLAARNVSQRSSRPVLLYQTADRNLAISSAMTRTSSGLSAK